MPSAPGTVKLIHSIRLLCIGDEAASVARGWPGRVPEKGARVHLDTDTLRGKCVAQKDAMPYSGHQLQGPRAVELKSCSILAHVCAGKSSSALLLALADKVRPPVTLSCMQTPQTCMLQQQS